MATELSLNPIPTGETAAATQRRVMVSDTSIAEQFCMVAADMRSILAAMKTSVDLQRQMVEAFDSYSAKLDATMQGIDAAVNKIDDLIAQTGASVNQLNTNTEVLKASLEKLTTKLT